MAREILNGFGDSVAGEWTEHRPLAFHLRRRLSASEQQRIGEAIDCRNTEEAARRLEQMRQFLRPGIGMKMALKELGL